MLHKGREVCICVHMHAERCCAGRRPGPSRGHHYYGISCESNIYLFSFCLVILNKLDAYKTGQRFILLCAPLTLPLCDKAAVCATKSCYPLLLCFRIGVLFRSANLAITPILSKLIMTSGFACWLKTRLCRLTDLTQHKQPEISMIVFPSLSVVHSHPRRPFFGLRQQAD